MSKSDIEHDYLDPSPHHVQALLMKAHFLIGKWMVNPKMGKVEADAWKLDLSHYVANTPEALKTFISLLELSEPQGVMSDCDVWKCAKNKSTQFQSSESLEVASEGKVTIYTNEWPCPNYACRRVEPDVNQPLSDGISKKRGFNTKAY